MRLHCCALVLFVLVTATDYKTLAGRITPKKNASGPGLRGRSTISKHRSEKIRGLQAFDYHGGSYMSAVVRKHKNSCKSKSKMSKSKMSKKNTCAPSSQPSSAPTESAAPTEQPSVSPSDRPSLSPSTSPSDQPTISTNPSSTPSNLPSVSPSNKPSMVPSAIPSLSAMPSEQPSQFPSLNPSSSPSYTPTSSPSELPSVSPSVSNVPTDIVFETIRSGDRGGGGDVDLKSTCMNDDSLGTIQEQTLAFNYKLYLKNTATNPQDTASILEELLHFAMTWNFLTCNFDSVAFDVVSIASIPPDTVSDQPCDDPPDPREGSLCVVVNAGITLSVVFQNGGRELQETNASPEVRESFRDYLKSKMAGGDFIIGDILQLSFQGFTNVKMDGTETGGTTDRDGISAITGDSNVQAILGESNAVTGSAIVAVAAVCLMVVAVLFVRKRNARRDAYVKHLEGLSDMSEFSLDEKAGRTAPFSLDSKVQFVMDDQDYDSFGEEMRQLEEEEMAHHDVYHCASATCPICQKNEVKPTFISTQLDYEMQSIQAELGPSRFQPKKGKSFRAPAPDTVDL
jgi:hypothetical protein